MNYKSVVKRIKRRKKLLNILLLFLSPTNKLMVNLSQDLDKYISQYQKQLSIRHHKKHYTNKYKKIRKTAWNSI